METIDSILTDFAKILKTRERYAESRTTSRKKGKPSEKRQALLKTIILNTKCNFDIKFQDFKDVYNVKVFCDNFQRPALTELKSKTFVTLEDVKDVVLYTAIFDLPTDFIKLFLCGQVDRLLRSLVLYMQYFSEIFRVVLKRREAVNYNKLRHPISACVEVVWKETLSNLRFIVGRDYLHLVMGLNGTEEFHHYDKSRKCSRKQRDLVLFQLLHIFARRVVQVVLMEKDNVLIEEEMDRIFTVGGPKIDRKTKYGLTKTDTDILEHNFSVPRLLSKAEVSKEFARPGRNSLLTSIGQTPWLPRDSSSYFLAIEMCLAGAESYFNEANLRVGLLGYERKEFDCFLNLESPPLKLLSEKSVTSEVDTTVGSASAVLLKLTDKSVLLTGPTTLVPKRDDNAPFVFGTNFLTKCSNFNAAHMEIRVPRWIEYRKANSRMTYEPQEQPMYQSKNTDDKTDLVEPTIKNEILPNFPTEMKMKSTLPTFFFTSTAKSDSEDDIFAQFHEGFYQERVKKLTKSKKKA